MRLKIRGIAVRLLLTHACSFKVSLIGREDARFFTFAKILKRLSAIFYPRRIRKYHKICLMKCFLDCECRGANCPRKKTNGRIDRRGKAAALHHVCTRCTYINMRVVFRWRNLLMRRVSSIISRSGSTVTQDMCQRCIDVSNGCVGIGLFVHTKKMQTLNHF